MLQNSKWICSSLKTGDVCPVFRSAFAIKGKVSQAKLSISALGLYEAKINGVKVGEQVLTPGWTSYDHRIQYQTYDIKDLLNSQNMIEVIVAKGWYSSPMPGWKDSEDKHRRSVRHVGMIAELAIWYEDGSTEVFPTDSSWFCAESNVRFCEIYDGETYDASFVPVMWKPVVEFEGPTTLLIPQQGEDIKEMERISALAVFRTPAGENVVDFGQEITGYFEFTVDAHNKDIVTILCGEMLDKDGNFYRENYRSAKAMLQYICKEGRQTWHPVLTFYGFRYIKLVDFPGICNVKQFTAISVYSNIRRTGWLACGVPELNQLFSNIIWGQKDNFLDVPTDCPQRDERLGWTGDAQVFVKTATYNFDVERFYRKWLKDLAFEQRPDGAVGQVIPDYLPECEPSAAWSDVATICPWQVYQTYGDQGVLRDQFQSMRKWVDYITHTTTTKGLWVGGTHFGDWLGLDAPEGSYKGSSRDDFIASAYYAHSTELVVKTGHVLGEDVRDYEKLLQTIIKTFRKQFPTCLTQTEHVLALQFGLAEKPQQIADELAIMIEQNKIAMQTGFVGTGYLLHALSLYGHIELAYSLLLRKQYPSWLYSVTKGATTIWEHWDGIKENGDFWSSDMNSFNHYAYGSVADWIYEIAAGIQHDENSPGFATAKIAPHPDPRVGWLRAELLTRHGRIRSGWICQGKTVRYEIEVAMPSKIVLGDRKMEVEPGTYTFWNNIPDKD